MFTPNGSPHATCAHALLSLGWSYSADSGFIQWSPWCRPNPTGAQCRCQQNDHQGTMCTIRVINPQHMRRGVLESSRFEWSNLIGQLEGSIYQVEPESQDTTYVCRVLPLRARATTCSARHFLVTVEMNFELWVEFVF